MTFKRLIEIVTFEAGATNLSNLETVASLIIEEVLDKHTSQIRYTDLYVPNTVLVVSNLATGKYTLPTDLQHIDLDKIRVAFGGDLNELISILPYGGRIRGVNEGKARYFHRDASFLYLYPYDELVVGDVVYIDYWRKSNARANDLIVPDCLVLTVKDEAVGRLALSIGSKSSAPSIVMSRESHAASLGSTDLPSAND